MQNSNRKTHSCIAGPGALSDSIDDIERTILLYTWSQADVCPLCGCDSDLRVGVETGNDRVIEVDCNLCDALLEATLDQSEVSL